MVGCFLIKFMKVLVVQNGARHHYAVPAVLQDAGMLAGFYTDICGDVGLGRSLSALRCLPLVGRKFHRLHQRQVSSQAKNITATFPVSTVVDRLMQRVRGNAFRPSLTERSMLHKGFQDAQMIYSSLGWGHSFLKEARSRGIKIVTEFYVRPSLWKVYQQEYLAYPGWQERMPFEGYISDVGTETDPCTVSDFVIVPHEGVADDIAEVHRFPRERINVVPYAVSSAFLELKNEPVLGRILFAGTCSLGKGIHYFAMAAEILVGRGLKYDFRVAGNASSLVCSQSVCRHLNFIGRLPRPEMLEEYRRADVFVLPSLSEGSAGVTYEALAAGVPQVVTHAAGSMARDGIEGLIVPERDATLLADAIQQLVEDRDMRDRMAAAARERAKDYTWEKYGNRLVNSLRLWNAQKIGSQ